MPTGRLAGLWTALLVGALLIRTVLFLIVGISNDKPPLSSLVLGDNQVPAGRIRDANLSAPWTRRDCVRRA